MSVRCPFCQSENTTSFSDIKTKEFGYQCLDCKKDFGVSTIDKQESFISSFKKMKINYKLDLKEYKFVFNKVENKVSLKMDSYIDKIHNDFDEIDFTSLFDNFISILINQFFIFDIENSEIDHNKDFFIIEIESDNKIIKKTNKINYYLDLLSKLMFQLIGGENEKS